MVENCDKRVNIVPAVVEAVADTTGVDPCELETPLYEVIDPDALEALVAHARGQHCSSSGTIRFEFNGCLVEVHFSGDINVRSAVASSETVLEE